MSQQRFCDQCGFELAISSRFCGGCGTRLMTVDQEPLSQVTSEPITDSKRIPVIWRSTEEDPDLAGFPYAEAAEMSQFAGSLMMAISSSGTAGQGMPPVFTTWLADVDDGVIRRTPDLGQVSGIFGSFVISLGLHHGSWDALEIESPLGYRGLVMLSEASWPEGSRSPALRILVPLAYGVDPATRDRAQLQASVDWLLSKVVSPYLQYVPPVMSDADRNSLLQRITTRAGTRIPGPLSEREWLAQTEVSAVSANLQGFPGVGSLRLGVLEEHEIGRTVSVFRDEKLVLVDVPAGTVDVYAGWQVELDAAGVVGLMALGHRSAMALIDAINSVPGLADELGGIPPSA